MAKVIITGSGSGLGKTIYEAIESETELTPYGVDIKNYSITVDLPLFDITCESSWDCFKNNSNQNDIIALINCAGINKICPFEEITVDDYNKIMDVNLKGIMLASQALLPVLKKNKGTIINVISNASHMPMTDSFIYNASKGAGEIATRQMARELTRRHGITVFGISPNKLKGTEMSDYIDNTFPPMRGMTFEEGREYQLNGLLTGKETDPKTIAGLVAYLLKKKEHHEYLSGCVLELGL